MQLAGWCLLPIILMPSIIVGAEQFSRVTGNPTGTDTECSWGVCWVDYDDDGYLDIFVTNGYYFNGSQNYLYHNNQDGSFSKTAGDIITSTNRSSVGASWADFDGDHDLDCFVANGHFHNNELYLNDGDGTFSSVAEGHVVTDGAASQIPGWVDYDGDGDLDLFVANGGPYPGAPNFLYRNDNGQLMRITVGIIVTEATRSYCIGWSDYDNDGDPDLFMANTGVQNNVLYVNQGSGLFSKLMSGPTFTRAGQSRTCSWGDYDNDGYADLFVGNGINDNFLYHNNGDGSFTEITQGPVVTDGGWTFGSAWGDYDNDGHLDLFVANAVYDYSAPSYNFLYRNNGDGTFTKVTEGVVVTYTGICDGAAWGDYDRDGDLDLFVAHEACDETNSLYRNNGNDNNWINIKVKGTAPNTSAIGTKVRVKAVIGGNPVWQLREISSQTGCLSQNSLNAHFGLGDATIVDSVLVEWADSGLDVLTGVSSNQFMSITEGQTGSDTDSDDDGITNFYDNCPTVPNPGQADTDVDGLGDDCDDCTDTDGDGYGDPGYPVNTCDPDVCDGFDDNIDSDLDLVPDQCDNCPSSHNPHQEDTDDDGAGDACDPCPSDTFNDSDQDGFCADQDNCPWDANPGQEDADGDGVGDACCCDGRVGNANQSGEDEPTIGDVSVMIDAMFITGSCDGIIGCPAEADINQSGGPDPTCDDITIGDISTLIDYLFITGQSLGLPECL